MLNLLQYYDSKSFYDIHQTHHQVINVNLSWESPFKPIHLSNYTLW